MQQMQMTGQVVDPSSLNMTTKSYDIMTYRQPKNSEIVEKNFVESQIMSPERVFHQEPAMLSCIQT
jgi:hypothetical protein